MLLMQLLANCDPQQLWPNAMAQSVLMRLKGFGNFRSVVISNIKYPACKRFE
jgi:hypothetical protein